MKLKSMSRLLVFGILLNNIPINSFASVLSEDTRYETLADNNITINDVLEEDKTDIKIEGNTLVNLMNNNNIYASHRGWTLLDDGYLNKNNTDCHLDFIQMDLKMYKPNTLYTFIVDIKENNSSRDIYFPGLDERTIISSISTTACNSIGRTVGTFTTLSDFTGKNFGFYINSSGVMDGSITIRLQIFEGDLTDNPPTEYIEGLKSSFEDQLITQEMVDNGQEKAENLGKYKVEYKVTGKNKVNINNLYDKNNLITDYAGYGFYIYPLKAEKNKEYSISVGSDNLISNDEGVVPYLFIGDNVDYNKCTSRLWINHGDLGFRKEGKITTSEECIYIFLSSNMDYATYLLDNIGYIQIEESSTVTEYEAYKESIKTFYLNSSLLKWDTIEVINGQAYHIKRSNEIVLDGREENWSLEAKEFNLRLPDKKHSSHVYSDRFKFAQTNYARYPNNNNSIIIGSNDYYGILIRKDEIDTIDDFKQWLQKNPTKVVYELANPIYEPIKADLSVNLFEGTTHISNNSNIPATMEVTVDRTLNRAVEYTELAKANPTINNLSKARMWNNLLKDSIKKDQLQEEVNSITKLNDMVLDKKTATSNLDLYIKCENILQMSLSTNNITFEDFSGIEDMEKVDAVQISINSSLPYSLNAYLPTEIQNSDKSNIMNKDILNIKENSETIYQTFTNTTDKIVLKDNCSGGNDLVHNIDIKLKSGIAHAKDVYKTTIKFEAEQK